MPAACPGMFLLLFENRLIMLKPINKSFIRTISCIPMCWTPGSYTITVGLRATDAIRAKKRRSGRSFRCTPFPPKIRVSG
jgi:hypothetical protein